MNLGRRWRCSWLGSKTGVDLCLFEEFVHHVVRLILSQVLPTQIVPLHVCMHAHFLLHVEDAARHTHTFYILAAAC